MTLNIAEATVYDFPFSSASYRLRIALNLKGLAPARIERVNLRAGDQYAERFLAIAAAPLVPTVDFGAAAFSQSLALIDWLDAAYPEPRLTPAEPETALAAREIALMIACDIHPLNTPRVLKRLKDELGASDAQREAWYAGWVREGFAALERKLAKRARAEAFCVGDAPSIADICLAPQVLNARRFNVPIDDFDRITAIAARCDDLDAFRNAAPQAA